MYHGTEEEDLTKKTTEELEADLARIELAMVEFGSKVGTNMTEAEKSTNMLAVLINDTQMKAVQAELERRQKKVKIIFASILTAFTVGGFLILKNKQ